MKRSTEILILCAIACVGFALRIWHVDFGLPTMYHPDENTKAEVILRVLDGKPPDYFLHPGLLINLSSISSWISTSMLGNPMDRATVTLAGRIVSVLVGAAAIPLVWALARTRMGAVGALVATAIFAFAPMNVVHSRYMKEDVYLVTSLLIVALGALRWFDAMRANEATRKWAIVTIVGCGILVASKFVGWLVVFAIIAWLAKAPSAPAPRGRRIGMLLAGTVLVFVMLSPQVLYFGKSMSELALEFGRTTDPSSRQKLAFYEWPDIGTYFFRYGLGPGMTWPVIVIAMIGLIQAIRKRSKEALVFAVLAIAWYAISELSSSKRGIDRERYVMPAIPFLAIVAGWWLASLQAGWKRMLAIGACVAMPLAASFEITRALRPDSREEATAWLDPRSREHNWRVLSIDEMYPAVNVDNTPVKARSFTEMSKSDIRGAMGRADAVVMSSFSTVRYDRMPGKSRKELEKLALLREEFPHVVKFGKRWPAAEVGFHNPTIEIRFRTAEAAGE